MDPNSPEAQAHAMRLLALAAPMFAIFWLVIMAIIIIPLWKICTKAGLSGPLSLLALIPAIGMLVVLYVVAFSEWKVVPLSLTSAYPTQYPPPSYPPAGYPPTGPAA